MNKVPNPLDVARRMKTTPKVLTEPTRPVVYTEPSWRSETGVDTPYVTNRDRDLQPMRRRRAVDALIEAQNMSARYNMDEECCPECAMGYIKGRTYNNLWEIVYKYCDRYGEDVSSLVNHNN